MKPEVWKPTARMNTSFSTDMLIAMFAFVVILYNYINIS